MLEWILIILVIAAIFYASDLPKLRDAAKDYALKLIETAKEKKAELQEKAQNEKVKNDDSSEK